MADDLLLSAYEVARQKLIEDNQAMLQSLGLGSNGGSAPIGAGSKPKVKVERTNNSKKRAPAPRKRKAPQGPVRRSARLKGEKTAHIELQDGLAVKDERAEARSQRTRLEIDGRGASWDDIRVRRKIAILKELHLQNGTAYKNPTATYEHTWMRVRTMSKKRLSTRVKVIERALGQHCIVKLQMFAEVLILSGMDDLAAEAKAALDRVLQAVHGTSSRSPKVQKLKEQAANATIKTVQNQSDVVEVKATTVKTEKKRVKIEKKTDAVQVTATRVKEEKK